MLKMKYSAFIYTIFMAFALAVLVYCFSNTQVQSRDMVYYNDQLKSIEKEFQGGEDRSAIQKKHGCTILFLSDEDYQVRINQLMKEGAVIFDYYEGEYIAGKIAWNEEQSRYEKAKESLFRVIVIFWTVVLLAGYVLFAMVYGRLVRPFQKLQNFSAQIAKGNFDFPLPMEKHNYFGAFTESFDIMREELRRAKESEYQANRSKKELVAELSHDMKTPIATIKATCEVISLKEKNPDTLDKVSVIATKADMIDHLISNMFHATLEELEVLKVDVVEESSQCIVDMIKELQYYGEIVLEDGIPECLVYLDPIRFQQVVDNIVNNSYKYAGTAIFISFHEMEEGIRIIIRDQGDGVSEEELALITGKYYRGSNTKGKTGSGLGLYLSKMFMEQMQGGLECYNQDGFVVELFVKKV